MAAAPFAQAGWAMSRHRYAALEEVLLFLVLATGRCTQNGDEWWKIERASTVVSGLETAG